MTQEKDELKELRQSISASVNMWINRGKVEKNTLDEEEYHLSTFPLVSTYSLSTCGYKRKCR
jgi:hypothetical protein